MMSKRPVETTSHPRPKKTNQHKTCIKHTFLTKRIIQKNIYFTDLPTLFFQTVTGNKQFLFFRPKRVLASRAYVCYLDTQTPKNRPSGHLYLGGGGGGGGGGGE